MLQKFKITTCAFILCLFGLTLITVSPVLAEDSAAFVGCKQIKGDLKGKKNCFKRLARELEAAVNTAAKDLETLQAAADKTEAEKVELQAAVDKADKDCEDLQPQFIDKCKNSELAMSYMIDVGIERAEDQRNRVSDMWMQAVATLEKIGEALGVGDDCRNSHGQANCLETIQKFVDENAELWDGIHTVVPKTIQDIEGVKRELRVLKDMAFGS